MRNLLCPNPAVIKDQMIYWADFLSLKSHFRTFSLKLDHLDPEDHPGLQDPLDHRDFKAYAENLVSLGHQDHRDLQDQEDFQDFRGKM